MVNVQVVITLSSYYVGPVTGQDPDQGQGHAHHTTGGDRQCWIVLLNWAICCMCYTFVSSCIHAYSCYVTAYTLMHPVAV